MQPVTAYAPSPDPHAAYLDYLAATGRGSQPYRWAARVFFGHWPDPQAWAAQSLPARLAEGRQAHPPTDHVLDAAPDAPARL